MNYLTTEDGKPIKSTNPLPVSSVITDEDGNNVKISDSGEMKTVTTVTDADGNKLAILANGKLPVDLTLTGDTELTGSVELIDGTDSTKKAKITEDGSLSVQLSGSKVSLSTEPKPAGVDNDTLLEYNAVTKETKVYKYISGEWREL